MQYNNTQTQTLDVDQTVGQWNTSSGQTHAIWSSTLPHSGGGCLNITTDVGNVFGNYRAWPSAPGYDLTVAGGSATSAKQVTTWLRANSGTYTVAGKITWVAADGTTILGTTTYQTLTIGTTWVKMDSGSVTPPASTKYANINYTISEAGANLFVDDMQFVDYVAPTTPTTNYPTTQTAGLESTGVGEWATVSPVTLAKSTAQAHTGTGSLLATPSAAFTSFFARPSYPGYAINPGNKTLSVWARANTSTLLELRITWYDVAQAVLTTTAYVSQTVPATTWTKLDANAGGSLVTPPAGGVFATVVCYIDGNTPVYWDDLVFADAAATGSTSSTSPSAQTWVRNNGSFGGIGNTPAKIYVWKSGAWFRANG